MRHWRARNAERFWISTSASNDWHHSMTTTTAVGWLIMFKECLRHDVMPFIIDDKRRTDYLEGIRQWDQDRSILTDVVLDCQAHFEAQIALQNLREYGEIYDPINPLEEDEEE